MFEGKGALILDDGLYWMCNWKATAGGRPQITSLPAALSHRLVWATGNMIVGGR